MRKRKEPATQAFRRGWEEVKPPERRQRKQATDQMQNIATHKISAPSDAAIASAGAAIRAGALVGFPTETVYGLGADATNGTAVARVYAAKGRPRFNPLIVHVADLAAAQRIAVIEHGPLLTCARTFWPGGLTLVAPRQPGAGISELATAGLDTVAVRVPSHPVASAFLRAADRPVVGPSANLSGSVSATRAEHVSADLGSALAAILDSGPTEIGLESTILAAGLAPDTVVLLRAGALPAETIAAATGLKVMSARDAVNDRTPTAPGQLTSHYAPRARVRLNVIAPAPDEALLAFGATLPGWPTALTRNLSARGDLIEAAANLFSYLRELDAMGPDGIAVMPVPETGLGAAINDRLRRAAAPRHTP